MLRNAKATIFAYAITAVMAVAWTPAPAASPFFVEPDVDVLYSAFGEQAGDSFGWVAEDLGDIDGDGVNDIFIGDFAAFRDGPRTGRAYLYSGRDGHRLGVINAENIGDGVGPGRIVPDVDGDGLGDVYVAAFRFGENFEGKAWVRSGRGGIIRTMTGTEPGAFLGIDALSLEDVNDDGRTDFLLTGNGVIHVIAGN